MRKQLKNFELKLKFENKINITINEKELSKRFFDSQVDDTDEKDELIIKEIKNLDENFYIIGTINNIPENIKWSGVVVELFTIIISKKKLSDSTRIQYLSNNKKTKLEFKKRCT